MRQIPAYHRTHPHRKRCPGGVFLIGCLLCLAIVVPARAQDDQPPAPHVPIDIAGHAWAQFGIGSWKRVKVSKEVFGANGKLESVKIREATTTLVAVNEDRFTLREQVQLEVAGRVLDPVQRTIERGLYNETPEQTVSNKRIGEGKVLICGREYPSHVHEITLADGKSKWVSRVHYSTGARPLILRRNTICSDVTGKVTNYEAAVEVLAFNMPHRVLAEIKPATHYKTVHVQENVTTVTLEVSCASVPGHIVAHAAKMVTADGRLLERSTLELLEYEVTRKQVDN